jgi:hypothetical protein
MPILSGLLENVNRHRCRFSLSQHYRCLLLALPRLKSLRYLPLFAQLSNAKSYRVPKKSVGIGGLDEWTLVQPTNSRTIFFEVCSFYSNQYPGLNSAGWER